MDSIGWVPDRLYFTDSDEANELIATDPMALLIGFALDQQVTVQKAFSGPLAIKERVGTLDAAQARRGRPRARVPRETGDPPLPRRKWPSASTTSPCTSATSTAATPRGCGRTPRTPTSCAPTSKALPGLRRDEGQGARRGARQALRLAPARASCRRTRRSATSTRRRRWSTTRPPSARTRRSGRR